MINKYNFDITLHPWGTNPERGVVGIDTFAQYGYWEHKDGSEGGGLWFVECDDKGTLELSDFDGYHSLPRSVVAALRAAGVVLDEVFNA